MAQVQVEALFMSALGLQAPWEVDKVDLNTVKRRIDLEVVNTAKRPPCPGYGAAEQGVHDRVRRSRPRMEFFTLEAWLHGEVPCVGYQACGKTTQIEAPWAHPGSGFTLLMEAPSPSLCRGLTVRRAGQILRMKDKAIWRRIAHYVNEARAQQDMRGVRLIGIDETSLKPGHEYVTVVNDLDAKRLLVATSGRDHRTLHELACDLRAHAGEPSAIARACMDMSGAYLKGVTEALPRAQISYERYHVVALANAAMDEVRAAEWKAETQRVQAAFGDMPATERRELLWAMRRNPGTWSAARDNAMHWLQRANLKSTQASPLKMGLREMFAHARRHKDAATAADDRSRWIGWAQRRRLEPFKRLGATLRDHFDAVARSMLEDRSNAFVEPMNGPMQQAKRAARGYRAASNFIAAVYLRLCKLKHVPTSPFINAIPDAAGLAIHRA